MQKKKVFFFFFLINHCVSDARADRFSLVEIYIWNINYNWNHHLINYDNKHPFLRFTWLLKKSARINRDVITLVSFKTFMTITLISVSSRKVSLVLFFTLIRKDAYWAFPTIVALAAWIRKSVGICQLPSISIHLHSAIKVNTG